MKYTTPILIALSAALMLQPAITYVDSKHVAAVVDENNVPLYAIVDQGLHWIGYSNEAVMYQKTITVEFTANYNPSKIDFTMPDNEADVVNLYKVFGGPDELKEELHERAVKTIEEHGARQ